MFGYLVDSPLDPFYKMRKLLTFNKEKKKQNKAKVSVCNFHSSTFSYFKDFSNALNMLA